MRFLGPIEREGIFVKKTYRKPMLVRREVLVHIAAAPNGGGFSGPVGPID
jgi:hypothetical protein